MLTYYAESELCTSIIQYASSVLYFSHGHCLNNILQVLLIGNQKDQVSPFRYINQEDEVCNLVRGIKLPGDTKYLMRSVKQAAKAVGIWTEDHWDVKRVN